jgi:hypothetical protein
MRNFSAVSVSAVILMVLLAFAMIPMDLLLPLAVGMSMGVAVFSLGYDLDLHDERLWGMVWALKSSYREWA